MNPHLPGSDSIEVRSRDVIFEDISVILEQEAELFPLSEPLNSAQVATWVNQLPLFSRVYEAGGLQDTSIVGNLICIPLHGRSWHQLIQGELNEADLGKNEIFNVNEHSTLGIHVYHVQNMSQEAWKKSCMPLRFRCLIDLGIAVAELHKTLNDQGRSLEVCGFSGAC
jgi:hypothetical protein